MYYHHTPYLDHYVKFSTRTGIFLRAFTMPTCLAEFPSKEAVLSFKFVVFCIQCRGLAPGAYDIAVGGFSDRSIQQRSQGPGWRRAQEVARLAGIPHMLYKEQWNHKKFLVRKM